VTTNRYRDRLGVPRPDLAALVQRRPPHDLKTIDLLVAVLLERDGPVRPEAAAARLAEVGVRHWKGDLVTALKRAMAPSPEVSTDEEGRFYLAILDTENYRLRRRLERIWPPEPRPRTGGPTPEEIERSRRKWEEALAAERAAAARLRRVLLHGVRVRGALAAVALLDPARREIETFVGDELAGLRDRLEAFDLAVAISPRPLLAALGADPDAFRLADLDRPRKTRKLNRRGRVLRITNELLISGTLGRGKPLGEEAKYRTYLDGGQERRLRRRLEADVKALWAYYRFGVLHRAVRLRWGFVDEWVPVEWAESGDPGLHALARQALEEGRRLELVVGAPPAWSDPWGRAIRVDVIEPRPHHLAFVPVDAVAADLERAFEARVVDRVAAVAHVDFAGGGRFRLLLTLPERDLILEHCLALDPDTERRLKLAPLRGGAAIELLTDLDELEDLLGHLAAAANHAPDPRLQRRLDALCERLAAVERGAVS
jgi:hypothetical protein